MFSDADGELQLIQPRQLQRASSTPDRTPAFRTRRPRHLRIPIQQLQWPEKSASCRYKLLWPAGSATRLHQRREEHVELPRGTLRLQEGRHGHLDRRPTESHEPAHEAESPPSDALASEGCEARRLALLPLFRCAPDSVTRQPHLLLMRF